MLTINGRFLTQRMPGVERHAHKMQRALDGILATREAASGLAAARSEPAVSYVALRETLTLYNVFLTGSGLIQETLGLSRHNAPSHPFQSPLVSIHLYIQSRLSEYTEQTFQTLWICKYDSR